MICSSIIDQRNSFSIAERVHEVCTRRPLISEKMIELMAINAREDDTDQDILVATEKALLLLSL